MGTTREVMKKAAKDEKFRERLLKNPKATIAKEFGVEFPEGVTIQLHENSANVIHLVLPPMLELSQRSLSDKELQQVAGGVIARRPLAKSAAATSSQGCWGATSPFMCPF